MGGVSSVSADVLWVIYASGWFSIEQIQIGASGGGMGV